MTPWEFRCCIAGFNKANGAQEVSPEMTDEDYDALCELGDKWSMDNGIR